MPEKTKLWERKWSEKEEESNKWNKEEGKGEKKDEGKIEQTYTYEGAIQGYRSRVKSNLNKGNFSFMKNELEKSEKDEEANIIVPKGSILKRKELFENDKMFELNSYESIASRRLCEDFVHSQSLKERLLSLEKFTEQPLRTTEEPGGSRGKSSKMLESIKSDLEKSKNNTVINNRNDNWNNKTNEEISDRSSSPETNLFVNKLEKFHNSLENLAGDNDRDGSECGANNYPASNSSAELLGTWKKIHYQFVTI